MSRIKTLLAAAALALLAFLPQPSSAQTGCSIFVQGNVPTPGQWNNCLQQKQDVLGYTAVNRAGDAMAGRLSTTASTTFRAGLAILPGIAPSAPVDGDIWTTTAGLFARINGSTIGPVTATGSTIPAVVQGDILFGSGPATLSALAKNISATRYLSNTGTSNNPAWSQINLANGVTGLLPLANIATGTQDTALGYFGSTAVSAATLPSCGGALTYNTTTHLFGCNSSGSVIVSGTPTANMIAQWTNSTTIQGTHLSSVLAAGGGISLSGSDTVTIALANSGSAMSAGVSNPAATASVTQVMMGMGSTCTITPGFSTRLRFSFQGAVLNNTNGSGGTIGGRYGTGAAPANGVAGTAGSAFLLNSISFQEVTGNLPIPFAVNGIATGLTPGVAVWFDLGLSASANTSFLQNMSCNAQEF